MSKLVSYGIFSAIMIGLIFPTNSNLKIFIPYLLAIILFFSFLKLDYKFKSFFCKELLYYFIVGILIIPYIVFTLTKSLDFNLRLGLFLVSITPTAIGAPIINDLVRGNKEFIVSNVVLYNMLSPITYSVLLGLYFKTSEVVIPIRQIFSKLLIMILVPFVLAFLFRKFSKVKFSLIKVSKYVSPIAFILVIGLAVSSASTYLRSLEFLEVVNVFLIVFFFALLSFLIGYNLSKDDKNKKTLSLVFGHKNSTLTTWVALSNFSLPVVIPMIFYIISHHIINGFLMYKYSKE